MQLLSEIIRIDPIIRVTWYTLATIYEEEGEKEKAIQCKIVASHLSGSKQAAGDWADLGTESRCAFSSFQLSVRLVLKKVETGQGSWTTTSSYLLFHSSCQSEQRRCQFDVGSSLSSQDVWCYQNGESMSGQSLCTKGY